MKDKSFGQEGSAPGKFNTACGVAVDMAGNILVVDGYNHRIQLFTAERNVIMGIVGSRGGGSGQVTYPVGIGISPSGKVYIVDCHNHRVQILNPDLTFSSKFWQQGQW